MAINEESRQLEIAAEAEALTRTLAHSTQAVPHPSDSYTMLGELRATLDHLAQVCTQLGTWHTQAQDDTHYDGEDGGRTGSPRAAATELQAAASALRLASGHVGAAHAHNAVVRWYEDPRQAEKI